MPSRPRRWSSAESCWLFQGFVILRYGGFDAAVAVHTCAARTRRACPRCYESIGHQLTGLFQRDAEWTIEQCAKGRPEPAPYCAAGATQRHPDHGKDLCYRTAASSLIALAPPAQRSVLCERERGAGIRPELSSGIGD